MSFDTDRIKRLPSEVESQSTSFPINTFSNYSKFSVPITSAEKLFQSSCAEILGRKASDLKERLIIQFTGEEGMVTKATTKRHIFERADSSCWCLCDCVFVWLSLQGTGVQREWFNSLSYEILNPDYALFIQSADGVCVWGGVSACVRACVGEWVCVHVFTYAYILKAPANKLCGDMCTCVYVCTVAHVHVQ